MTVNGREFVVSIASTGQEVVVGADETLLAALRRRNLATPYSCQQGFCGTCRTRVVSGAVDHREVRDLVKVDATFRPDHAHRTTYDRLYAEFPKLYKAQKGMFHRLNDPA